MSNALKLPYGQALNQVATNKALNAIKVLGKALPCSVVSVSGSIVTVSFQVQSGFTLPNVTMPMFGPEYIRYPTQVGDLGVSFPADARLGGITGLGSGIADLSLMANLSALVFFPVASTSWTATENANALVLYGPDGVIIRDVGKTATITVAPNLITMTATNITLNGATVINGSLSQGTGTAGGAATFEGPVTVVNNLTAEGTSVHTHVHSGVQSGGSNTGSPV